jgi:hypothetical protein
MNAVPAPGVGLHVTQKEKPHIAAGARGDRKGQMQTAPSVFFHAV